MALNLTALGCIAGAIITAFFLFRHYLPRAIAGAACANVCLRCGAPATSLTSFTCPGCGHDVRQTGVGLPRGRSPGTRFWLIVAFTPAFLIVVSGAARLAAESVPRVHTASRNVSMRLSSPEIQGVDLYLEGRGPRESKLRGSITGELFATGGFILLEIDLPSQRWRLLDLNAKQLGAGDRLDGTTIHRWMEAAGVPVATPVAYSDAAHIAGHLGRLAGVELEMPPVPKTGRALSLSYSASSGGSSGNQPDHRWAPLTVIAGSVAWLAAVWAILAFPRRSLRPAESDTAAPGLDEVAP